MRGWMAMLAIMLVMGLAQSAAAQAQAPAQQAESSWWSDLFGSKPKAEVKPKVEAPTEPALKTPAERHAEVDRLMRAFLRRQAVCDQLSTVGLATDNPGLIEEAKRLEEIAWQLYAERSSRVLGVTDPEEPNRDEEGADGPVTLPTPRRLPSGPRVRDGRIAPESRAATGSRGGER